VIPEEPPQPASYRQSQFPAFPGACEILLIRHGESEAYVEGTSFPLTEGHGDPALSPEGHVQAQRLASRLATAGIDALYVTTLRRTAQTAAPLATRLGLEPRVEPGLREVHMGEWEGGVYRKMVAEGHPVVRQAWAEERWDIIPGAEPEAQFAARTSAAIERIAGAHPGQRVAVVTHGGVIGQVLATAAQSRPFAFITADNASISRIVVADGRWIIRTFNDTGHLENGLWRKPRVRGNARAGAGRKLPG
jgi:2,3-bisphosphoglycerate-dependent phosphoglycerate mutase